MPIEEFTGKNLTRFGGAGLIRRFFEHLQLGKCLQIVGIGKRRENDYSVYEMCISLLYAFMVGVFRPMHMKELRMDKVFLKLVGLKRFPDQSTISRFLSRITVHPAEHIAALNLKLLKKIRKNFQELGTITLDMDSHVIPVFGNQQRAKKGYNPNKHGRKCYHPVLCFIGETRDYIGGIFRSGNKASGYKAKELLKEIMKRLPKGKEIRLRADSGFFSFEFLQWLLKRGIEFFVVVPQHIWVQRLILGIDNWREFGHGLSVGEMRLPFPTLKGVRLVVIREAVPKGEKPRKELKLFKIQGVAYNYQVIATNSGAAGEDVWRDYNQRACCENFIKEGIYGFGLDKSITSEWSGVRLYFELIMLAYNLMNWFKERALNRREKKEMAGTIRNMLFWIPGKLVRSGRKVIIKLCENWVYKGDFLRARSAFS